MRQRFGSTSAAVRRRVSIDGEELAKGRDELEMADAYDLLMPNFLPYRSTNPGIESSRRGYHRLN